MNEYNGYAEHYAIGQAMIVYGGSFMSNLGKALQNADSQNQAKIKAAWPDEWENYRQFAIRMYASKEATR